MLSLPVQLLLLCLLVPMPACSYQGTTWPDTAGPVLHCTLSHLTYLLLLFLFPYTYLQLSRHCWG